MSVSSGNKDIKSARYSSATARKALDSYESVLMRKLSSPQPCHTQDNQPADKVVARGELSCVFTDHH